MNIAGILAGGIGSRMGSEIPKQFIEIGHIPIIIRVINRFMNNANVDFTVIAMNKEWIDYCKKMLVKWNINLNKVIIIEGGNTRFESLCKLTEKAFELDKNAIVISHDCARVFVSDEIIDNNFKMINNVDCTTTSIPTIDTVIVSKNGITSNDVPERKNIFLDQGPQTYRANQFIKLSRSLSNEEKQNYMEAGRMYLDKGLKVGIVKGERLNFKMTTDFDIKYGEFLIKEEYVK